MVLKISGMWIISKDRSQPNQFSLFMKNPALQQMNFWINFEERIP